MSRRAILSVPASDPGMIAKALASQADEVVVDLEDAVSVGSKDAARANIATLQARSRGSIAVRVNALDTPWAKDDVAACVANPVVESLVVPKAAQANELQALGRELSQLEKDAQRQPILLQALIESATGLHQVHAVAAASERICALILGYADLAASMGRRPLASWQFAQDAVVLAARVAGCQAIDGPLLTIADDEPLEQAAVHAEALGFDGKWVIHPRQIETVQRTFTPSDQELGEAHQILHAIHVAESVGRGAVQWRGQMLDEAVAARSRRILDRAARI